MLSVSPLQKKAGKNLSIYLVFVCLYTTSKTVLIESILVSTALFWAVPFDDGSSVV